MWGRLIYVLAKVAQLAAKSTDLKPGQERGQARKAGSGRRGRDRGDLLDALPNLMDDRLSGAALVAGVETTRAMLNRPSVRASLEGAVLKLLGSAGEEFHSIEEVRESADRIVSILQRRGALPNRLGVDGLPGSGKSTLARALAERLGFKWKSLDGENMNAPLDFSPERMVYEHHRLFRTQDVDHFDAIVYVDESVEISKARVFRRAREEARGSLVIDLLDYDKLKEIGELAFDVCEGEPIPIPKSSLLVKIRPPGGFRAVENVVSGLRAAGRDAEGMEKEEMLFLLAYGKPRSGTLAYFLPGAYNEEVLRGLLAGIRRYVVE